MAASPAGPGASQGDPLGFSGHAADPQHRAVTALVLLTAVRSLSEVMLTCKVAAFTPSVQMQKQKVGDVA